MDSHVTETPSDCSASPQMGNSAVPDASSSDQGGACGGHRLDAVQAVGVVGTQFEVVAIDGDDAISERLAASGLWAGTVLEHIASASFGGPMLFRVHGYRLALRRSEAARVRVVEAR